MKFESKSMEEEGLLEVARKMAVAARTAPKGKGRDNLVSLCLTGKEKDELAAEMQRIGEEKDLNIFIRDAQNLRTAQVIVLLGTRIDQLDVPNCGFCGYRDCDENRENNGICAFNTGDLGIAIGSAVSIATDHRVDNRIMFTAGKAALKLGLLGKETRIIYGIPLSVLAKNPFFDRK
ncbi:MAG TPA: DUF2148 domain-containing protein [Spirochaetia bacterium]|nr:DUF2148 domain-containing protein [Spirochaetia bacterium]